METIDRWMIRGFVLVAAVAIMLIAGVVLPRLVIPEAQGEWTGSDAAAARYAQVRVGNAGGFGQKLLRTRTSVAEIEPGPEDCEWGYRESITSVATVQTYTLFGIPLETYTVDCDSESITLTLF